MKRQPRNVRFRHKKTEKYRTYQTCEDELFHLIVTNASAFEMMDSVIFTETHTHTHAHLKAPEHQIAIHVNVKLPDVFVTPDLVQFISGVSAPS